MDPLTALLDAPRARGAFLLRMTMAPPWSVDVRDEAPLAVVAVLRGSAWIAPAQGGSRPLATGDVLLCRGPAPYVIADSADSARGGGPGVVIRPGGRCESPGGASVPLTERHGVRTWGNDPDGPDGLLVGTYEQVGEVGSRLLAALPAVTQVPACADTAALVELIAGSIDGSGLGQASLLDRLLDVLTVAAVRQWVAREDSTPAAWMRASDDPLVRGALTLVHDDPARAWTVPALADAVGLSRAAFARRFAAAVGEPPMVYLSGWRLALAADWLRESDAPVSRIAVEVGYTSPFTFSAAFKRRYGVSPQAYRQVPRSQVPSGQVPR